MALEAAAICGLYGGVIYVSYKIANWIDGPPRRAVGYVNGNRSSGRSSLFRDEFGNTFVDGSSNMEGLVSDEMLCELDLDYSVLKHMDVEDRVKYIESKVQAVAISRCQTFREASEEGQQDKSDSFETETDYSSVCSCSSCDSETQLSPGVSYDRATSSQSCVAEVDSFNEPQQLDLDRSCLFSGSPKCASGDSKHMDAFDPGIRSSCDIFAYNEKLDKASFKC